MSHILDMPEQAADDLRALRRSVALDILEGLTEDAIYGRRVDVAVRAARLVVADESDVDIIAALAREDTAAALAGCRAEGLYPTEA